MKWMLWGSMLLLWASSAAAQTTAEEEYSKRIRAATTVEPLTHESFGAQVNLYNGSTEFSLVDVSLPGNDALAVEVRRHLPLEDRSTFKGALGGFGDWSLDVPYVHGLFAEDKGWKTTSGDGYSRCSVPAMPDTSRTGTPSAAYSSLVWDGYQLNIPGSGSQELLVSTVPTPPSPSTGGPYPWLTKDHHRVSCLPAAKNYPGEAFVVLSPNGVKYTLDHAIVRAATSVSDISRADTKYASGYIPVVIPRSHIYFVATKAEDRFGNTVEYHYVQDELRQITSSDGRSITLTWSGGKIASITSAAGTWNYAYRNGAVPYGVAEALDVVTRPDNSSWQYSVVGDLVKGAVYREDSAPPLTMCQHDLDRAPSSNFSYAVRAPWGAQATYRFAYTRHWRTYIPTTCVETLGGPRYPDVFGVFHQWSLQSLQVTGAGLPPMTWTYHYDTVEGAMYYRAPWPEPNWPTTATYVPGGNCATCRVSKTILVKGPTETIGYEFGIQYARNEGRLLSTSTATADGTSVLRTVTNTYLSEGAVASQPFPDNVGKSLLGVWINPMVARVRPVVSVTTSQDGLNAVRSHQSFDVFARPLSILKSNAQRSRTETAAYHDDLALWVLGQSKRITTDGVETSRTEYGWKASPTQTYAFGKLQQEIAYNTSNGTVSSVTDGNGNKTWLSNWKRGVPQSIQYPITPESPAGATQSALVNDAGWVESVTDENGYTTGYGYDLMGRLARITYPVNDSTVWNETTQVFEPVSSDEFGLPAGHWRQTVSTGNARKITYFDALWRPVLAREHDIADIAATQRFNVSGYDAAGRQIFASYPVASIGSVTDAIAGTRTTYDVLGRVRVVAQDSELGELRTLTDYQAGTTRVTGPKGNVSTTGFQFFDEVEFDRPLWIEHPGNIRTEIARDNLGRPLSIGRSGPDS